MGIHIGFVSTRFSGTDGVSLEAAKWSEVLEGFGHRCFWFAGESNRGEAFSFVEKRAHFKSELNEYITRCVFSENSNCRNVSAAISKEKLALKTALLCFIHTFQIDLLIVENALAIPMQIPLGLALTEVLSDSGIPAIAHHHDFFWERSRYRINGGKHMIECTFPPDLPNVHHVVINSIAQRELYERKGIVSRVIPNVMDYAAPPSVDAGRVTQFRAAVGLRGDDILVLQPTRLVPRKRVEITIDILRQIDDPRCKLVVSHTVDDEGWDYYKRIMALADKHGIDIRFVHGVVADPLQHDVDRNRRYSLWEAYAAADIVTYPSRCEGFGNAFLESIYLKKPIVMNRYETFVADIASKGFDVISFDGSPTGTTIGQIRAVLSDDIRKKTMVETNYRIARRFFSYELLGETLSELIRMDFSAYSPPLKASPAVR